LKSLNEKLALSGFARAVETLENDKETSRGGRLGRRGHRGREEEGRKRRVGLVEGKMRLERDAFDCDLAGD